ncbi:MAG: phosphoglucosamine mutase [Devosiaceae bacterium]|nr:phosphoglucosamine mutase [Devosiaceae bacterium]
MAKKYFGTDGIRGLANGKKLTPDLALKIGMATGLAFMRGDHRNRVVIGKDTRRSGYLIENALSAGFNAVGMDVYRLGPMPTPAVAMLTRSLRADLGVMISASHNQFEDNGIKLFRPDGNKLCDKIEHEIEALIDSDLEKKLVTGRKIGRVKQIDEAWTRYLEYAKRTLPRFTEFTGLKVVIDCANGAAYKVAPEALKELGAKVFSLGVTPNGYNINDGVGSTATKAAQELVLQEKADIGIALDGDADRVIIIDEKGQIVDGDQLMAAITQFWHEKNKVLGGGIAATIMSNLGLERFITGLGLDFERTKVGDRYVLEAMRNKGYNIGGEQSGHIILSDFSTTGDGLVAALQLLHIMQEKNIPVSQICNCFEKVPQLLRNIKFNGGEPLQSEKVRQVILKSEQSLGEAGRLVIRKSGTEPLIRIMGQGDNEAQIVAIVDDIEQAIRSVS